MTFSGAVLGLSLIHILLSRGEFLKLKPCRHGFQWVPVFGSQKGAIAILEKSGTAFEASNLYQLRQIPLRAEEVEGVVVNIGRIVGTVALSIVIARKGTALLIEQHREQTCLLYTSRCV